MTSLPPPSSTRPRCILEHSQATSRVAVPLYNPSFPADQWTPCSSTMHPRWASVSLVTFAVSSLSYNLSPRQVNATQSCASSNGTDSGADSYNEPYRPQVHFSPSVNFMNDPNGMFRHPGDGLWHLYYQYNPTAPVAGNQLSSSSPLPALNSDNNPDTGGMLRAKTYTHGRITHRRYPQTTPAMASSLDQRSWTSTTPLGFSMPVSPLRIA